MTHFDLHGKVVIVTGGGTGIGRGIAIEFAKVGANVVVGSRKQANLDTVVEQIRALGGQSLAIATDVRSPEQVDNLVKQTMDRFGKIDILVNNAGATFLCPIEDLSPNGWDTIFNINLKGAFLCSKAAGKVMIEQRSGKIINIASISGIYGHPGMAHYAAAKAGLINFTRSSALEWAKYNIYVNCIAPGMIRTEGSYAANQLTNEQERAKRIPLERPGNVEEIANTAIFLASEASSYITGETIVVQGGPPIRLGQEPS